jgi:iron complex transport system permease protein
VISAVPDAGPGEGDLLLSTRVADPGASPVPARSKNAKLLFGLLIAVAVLVLVVLASLTIGARPVPPGTVLDALFHYTGTDDQLVVRGLRVPRTLLGLAVGMALGMAGALMQALTRNPLADPGILGVNAGAAAAIVIAIGLFGPTGPREYVWPAFLGAALASVAVYLLGSRGRSGATPVRLALAGTALTAALTALVQFMVISNAQVFASYRFSQVGSLVGRPLGVLADVGPFIVLGVLVALGLSRSLNVIALGAHIGRTRVLGAVSITLLCGAATAAAGPIVFIGLAMPHVARAITGPDQRWLLPYAMVLSPILLLGADIIGRIALPSGEREVGLVTAFLGAPVFIALARKRRIAQL